MKMWCSMAIRLAWARSEKDVIVVDASSKRNTCILFHVHLLHSVAMPRNDDGNKRNEWSNSAHALALALALSVNWTDVYFVAEKHHQLSALINSHVKWNLFFTDDAQFLRFCHVSFSSFRFLFKFFFFSILSSFVSRYFHSLLFISSILVSFVLSVRMENVVKLSSATQQMNVE